MFYIPALVIIDLGNPSVKLMISFQFTRFLPSQEFYFTPVLPKPPSPREVSDNSST